MEYNQTYSIIDNGAGIGMKEAVAMLKEAIAEGNNFAKTEYAKALLFGNGVPKDNANAYALFKDAASYDLPEAVYYTGMLEYTGRGTVKDETKGSAKIQMAADMGFYEAEQFIDKLNAQKHINLLVNSKVGDRATVKVYLISMGAPINIDATASFIPIPAPLSIIDFAARYFIIESPRAAACLTQKIPCSVLPFDKNNVPKR